MRKNPPFLKIFLTIFTDLVQDNHNSFSSLGLRLFLGLSIETLKALCKYSLDGRKIIHSDPKRSALLVCFLIALLAFSAFY